MKRILLLVGTFGFLLVGCTSTPTPGLTVTGEARTETEVTLAPVRDTALPATAAVPSSRTPLPATATADVPTATPTPSYDWIQPDQMQALCSSAGQRASGEPTPGPFVVVWAESGELYRAVQSLLPDSLQPMSADDLASVTCVTRVEEITGSCFPSGDVTRIHYDVQLVSFHNGRIIASASLPGRALSIDCRGYPPLKEDLLLLLAEMFKLEIPGVLLGHAHSVVGLAFSPDGSLLASIDVGADVILWDVATRRIERRIDEPAADAFLFRADVAFSPDGSLLATTGPGAITLWSVETWEVVYRLEGQSGAVGITSMTFSPDGALLASCWIPDNVIIVWDMASGKAVQHLDGHSEEVDIDDVAFSPDGAWLASAADNEILVWNLASEDVILRLEETDYQGPFDLTFHPDGSLLASTGYIGRRDDPVPIIWHLPTGQRDQPFSYPGRFAGGFLSLALSPDGTILAGGEYRIRPEETRGIVLWNMATGRYMGRFAGHVDEVNTIAFSPDGSLLASGSFDHTIRLWDLRP